MGLVVMLFTYRLIPVLRGLRVESTQSFNPYFTHRSHGLTQCQYILQARPTRGRVDQNEARCSKLRSWVGRGGRRELSDAYLVFEHFLQAF